VALEAVELRGRQEREGGSEVVLADRMQSSRLDVPVLTIGCQRRVDLARDEPALEQSAVLLTALFIVHAELVERPLLGTP
jgi:hypothetical protein